MSEGTQQKELIGPWHSFIVFLCLGTLSILTIYQSLFYAQIERWSVYIVCVGTQWMGSRKLLSVFHLSICCLKCVFSYNSYVSSSSAQLCLSWPTYSPAAREVMDSSVPEMG